MEVLFQERGAVNVLKVQGRIDHAAAPAFQEALAPYLAACSNGKVPLALDFSAVEYISSIGLRALMLAARQVKAQGGRIAIVALTPLALTLLAALWLGQQVSPLRWVLALLDAWTDEIAQGLAGMVHIFNPQLILIGGGVSAQQKLLIEPIAAKVKASVMPAFAEGLEVRAAQLHNDAGMVGAVYYFRQTMEKE